MLKSFIKAARLRTLPLSVSGIIVGSFLAADAGFFDPIICLLALLTTVEFQILSNFANDYGDGMKGTDNIDRVGPQRAIQSGAITPKQMLRAIWVTIAITLISAISLIFRAFAYDDIVNILIFFILGVASIAAAIKYTMGKSAYGYVGLGDLFVLLFFGLLSVCGSYFLYVKSIDLLVFLPALTVGFLSMGVLNLNNMRDEESDKKSGKNTLVVKIGGEFARYYHYYLLISAFLFSLLYVVIRFENLSEFLFVVAFIPILFHGIRVAKTVDPKLLDPELKKLALSTVLYAVLFGMGYILA